MSGDKREAELQARPLGDGWVEVRIVYMTTPGKDDHHGHHTRGGEATRDIATFVLTFAAILARDAGAPKLAQAIQQLWRHVHHHTQHGRECNCHKTRH